VSSTEKPTRKRRSTGTYQRYAGKSTEQRDRERLDALIETGVELFSQNGYHRTPIEALCKHSKVTTRYFYQLVGNREALLRVIFDRIVAELTQATMIALQNSSKEPEDRLKNALTALLHTHLDDPRKARITCLETVGVSEEMEKHRRQPLHQFALLLEGETNRLAAAGRIPDYNYRGQTVALVGAMNEMVIDWLLHPNPPSIDTLIKDAINLFRTLLIGMEAQMQRR